MENSTLPDVAEWMISKQLCDYLARNTTEEQKKDEKANMKSFNDNLRKYVSTPKKK